MPAKLIKLFAIALVTLLALSLVPLSPAEAPRPVTRQAAGAAEVTVGFYVVGFGNFDPNKGTYTVDFYMWLSWDSAANITPHKSYEFMNGRAGSTALLTDETDDSGTREVWFRIQAALYHEPDFSTYPFSEQKLTVVIEDSKLTTSDLVYVPDAEGSGYDDSLSISGWEINSWSVEARDNPYDNWGETYSQLVFEIDIGRAVTTTALKTLLPPIIFCIVSGLSFFFKPDKIANRIGFGTSMLISAVMFHISQTASLPPMPSLMTIDKIMIATYGFLAASLLVTTLIYIDEEFWKDKDYTKQVNVYGGILAVALPFVIYAVLNL
jgi:hypothetical protein